MEDELLRALGQRQGRDPSSDTAMTSDATDADVLLRPFDERERAALLDGVMAQLGKGVTPSAPQPVVEEKVVELDERRGRSPATFVLALAIAAAAALVLWFVMQGPSRPPGPEVATLPTYAFTEMRGGIAKTRSGDETPQEVELRADDEVDWVITPATPVRDAVEVALLAVPDEGEPKLVRVSKMRVSASGAVRIEGKLSDIVELAPGGWTLSVLIAAPGGLPDDVEAARTDSGGRWRAARARAMIVAP